MLPLTTRSLVTAERGLAAGLSAAFALEPGAVVLETTTDPGPLGPVVALLREAGVPVLATLGPLVEGARGALPSVVHPVEAERRRALDAMRRTVDHMARFRCRRLIVPVGDADLPGADLLEQDLRRGEAEPGRRIAEWKARISGAREAAVDRLCRMAHALGALEVSVEVLLLPCGGPAGLLDPETASWVLEDVPRRNLGLALDTGTLGLGATRGGDPLPAWLDVLDAEVRFLLLSDHDGRTRSDLLPGAGVLDLAELRPALARSRPWAVRCDPSRGLAELRDCEALVRDRLGGEPDPAAWA